MIGLVDEVEISHCKLPVAEFRFIKLEEHFIKDESHINPPTYKFAESNSIPAPNPQVAYVYYY